ncbi:MAG: hotdog domain-containing protein [Gammaproteobacteria bacterium]
MARFVPQQHHCAAPLHVVNGGILATLMDCHCICTAIAAGYRDAGRPIGSQPNIHFVTAGMTLQYLRPAPIAGPLALFAEIARATDNGYLVSCTLEAGGKCCVIGEVSAARVSDAWMMETRNTQ